MCLNIKLCKCLVSNQTNMSKFHSLEVVGRGSETQLQVNENLNKMTWRINLCQAGPVYIRFSAILKPNEMPLE